MQSSLRTLQLIVGALGAGVFLVAGAMVLFRAEAPKFSLLTALALFWGIGAVAARSPLQRQIEAGGRKRIVAGGYGASRASRQSNLVAEHGDSGRLFLLYQTRAVVSAALLEGAGFLGAIATRVEGSLWGAGMALALGAIMLAEMPTHARWEAWREKQTGLLREEGYEP